MDSDKLSVCTEAHPEISQGRGSQGEGHKGEGHKGEGHKGEGHKGEGEGVLFINIP